jgi:CheY-like chemotaxis protein
VLLVDDDRASLDLVSAYLSESAARVVRARDGVEALQLVRQASPAAVVLDIRLPRLDGWEVLSQLKSDPATATIPVVVASVVDERSRGLALGAAEYLLKPVGRDDLLAALRRVGAVPAAAPDQGRAR